MKRTLPKFKIMAVLACLAYPGFAVPVLASDFFPLDLWEEMTDWQLHTRVTHEADIEAYRQAMTLIRGADVGHTTFPFDVAAELIAMGDSHRHESREYPASDGSTHRNRTSPYWLPEEFSTDGVFGLTACAKRNPSD
ncbi:hypothetical protein DSCA_55280 [Desulfosarcina alkanivorans]|uniref:Uncharacterized protein n=1 Tax=Desulfosarcina alkanivorans TaxID=571177 RepID=A0A5K7YSI0_9BACT|nr:hypothetical protein [Desulfosarcina alkanivorans]BBO71598.1 hypothetical protein DSCA_55280 [Desulfosarcina alkanivorans]